MCSRTRFELFNEDANPGSDIDLYVYRGTTQVGSSGGGTAAEQVNLVNPAADTYTVYVHGFVRTRPGRRHLSFADGTPFFWLGDTHWQFARERWDESNKPGWASQFRGTIDRRVRQGCPPDKSN